VTNAALAYGRKLFSIALVFNCLVTIINAIGLLTGFYVENWILFQPYLFDAGFLWVIIIVAILNLYPSMKIGRIRTGRLLFHHYVYGFIVLALSGAFLFLFTSVSIIGLFTENNTDLAINVGRFFVLGGLALILDDFGDICKVTKVTLDFLKHKAHIKSSTIHWIHLLLGFASLYILAAIAIWVILTPGGATTANIIFVGSLAITSITTFWGIFQKMWHKLYHIHPSEMCEH
jgi:hypothetical protein